MSPNRVAVTFDPGYDFRASAEEWLKKLSERGEDDRLMLTIREYQHCSTCGALVDGHPVVIEIHENKRTVRGLHCWTCTRGWLEELLRDWSEHSGFATFWWKGATGVMVGEKQLQFDEWAARLRQRVTEGG